MSASEGKKIGLLFGSFNPIHIGHLILAQHMANHTDLSGVWFVVSPQSPYKVGQQLLPQQDRLALVEAAIADNQLLCASDIEFQLPTPSYTISTLDELGRRYPQHQFALLMGGDNLVGLAGWKEVERIQQEYDIYVYPRPGYDIPTEAASSPRLRIVSAPLLDISATFIRQCLQDGRSIRYLVPEAVERQIAANHFWQAQ